VAYAVWGASGKKMQKSNVGGVGFIDVIGNWIDKCTVEDLALYAVIIRSIWLRRNIVILIHGGVFTHPNLLTQESAAFL
jgi:hypothetical protein